MVAVAQRAARRDRAGVWGTGAGVPWQHASLFAGGKHQEAISVKAAAGSGFHELVWCFRRSGPGASKDSKLLVAPVAGSSICPKAARHITDELQGRAEGHTPLPATARDACPRGVDNDPGPAVFGWGGAHRAGPGT